MARLNQLFEYLFVNAGSALVLDSGTTGVFQQPGAAPFPVFRTPLSSGQILLLFADVVPKTLSTQLLSGVPVEFSHETPQGVVRVHMTLTGDDLRVTAQAVRSSTSGVQEATDSREVTNPRGVVLQLTRPVAAGASLGPPPPDAQPIVEARRPLETLMAEMESRRSSHLHVGNHGAALLRIDGQLVPVQTIITEAELKDELQSLAPPALRDELARHQRVDFSTVTERSVFHLSLQTSRTGVTLVVRRLPRAVPTVASLGLPSELVQAMSGGGLWILSGPPGHGVTTSLAAVMQTVLAQRPVCARTLESPIEYVLAPGIGSMSQLEVGTDVTSFAEGLRDSLHDDVDVVMVSELDDADVLAEALTLAERGRLVMGSLHARSASQAAEKLVHLTQRNPAARWQLGQALRGIFAQVLAPNTQGGKSLAWELLPGAPSVRSAIVDGMVASFTSLRTRSLEQSLSELVSAGMLERDEALAVAPDRGALEGMLARASGIGRSAA